MAWLSVCKIPRIYQKSEKEKKKTQRTYKHGHKIQHKHSNQLYFCVLAVGTEIKNTITFPVVHKSANRYKSNKTCKESVCWKPQNADERNQISK